jgi:hypothetical protein
MKNEQQLRHHVPVYEKPWACDADSLCVDEQRAGYHIGIKADHIA